MSERSILVALLVVMVAIITVALISLAKLPTQAATPIAGILAGLATSAMGAIVVLIARNGGSGKPG